MFKGFFLYSSSSNPAFKTFILSALVFLISLTTFNVSSFYEKNKLDSNNALISPGSTTSNISLSGRAVKGVIVNGEISVYPIYNGVPDNKPIQTGLTDASGKFELLVPENLLTDSLYIEVTANNDSANPSIMYCDSYIGCAIRNWLKTEFGETFELKSRFLLRSFTMFDPVTNSYPIKFTPMEHLAVAYAESLNGGLTRSNFDTALAYLSEIFLLTENIPSMKAINLLSVDEVSNASDEEIVIAILSSAFLGIDNNIFSFKSIESVVNTLTKQNGLLPKLNEEDSNEITLPMIADIALSNIPPYLENRPNIRSHLTRIKLLANNQASDIIQLNLEAGSGGTIVSTSHSFECIGSCQYEFPKGEVISLQAVPDTDFSFDNWNNTCLGLTDQNLNTCEFVINETQYISATFSPLISQLTLPDSFTLLLSDNPNRSNAIPLESANLSGTAYIFAPGDPNIKEVTFYLDAKTGNPFNTTNTAPFDFNGTQSDGSAIGLDTSLLTNGSHSIYANILLNDNTIITQAAFFNVDNIPSTDNTNDTSTSTDNLILDVVINGAGSVVELNSGLACQATNCTFQIASGSSLHLSAVPANSETHEFSGWQGLCEGLSDCIVSLNSEQSITATFSEITQAQAPDESSTDPSAIDQTEIVLSKSPDRSNPMTLESNTISGLAYIELLSTNQMIQQVDFYLNSASGSSIKPISSSTTAPFDFNGTAASGSALPFDSGTLPNGTHYITAQVTLTDNTVFSIRSSFIVDNTIDKILSWEPPVSRENGTILSETDIAKYVIYYGPNSKTYTGAIIVNQRNSNNVLPTSISIGHLGSGTFYFAAVTVDSSGLGSSISNEIVKLVQ